MRLRLLHDPTQGACGDDDALRDLGAAATAVTEALNTLIQEVKEGVSDGGHYGEAVDAILVATERLFRCVGAVVVSFPGWLLKLGEGKEANMIH